MNLYISEAIQFVRSRLDELSIQESELLANSVDNLNLDETIVSLLEEAVSYVHQAAPASLMEGLILTQDDLKDYWSVRDGVLDIDLVGANKDMLRIISFKAADSDIKLTTSVYEDSPIGRMQHNKYVQGQPDNPVLVMLDDSPNYRPHIKYYTTDLTASNMSFVVRYFPLPKVQTYSISLNQSAITFVGSGASKKLSIFTELNWRIEGLPSWIIPSDNNGKGNKTITITTTENTTGSERSATLYFITDEGQAIVEIIQHRKSTTGVTIPGYEDGLDFLYVESANAVNGTINVAPTAGNTYEFMLFASVGLNWTVMLDGKTSENGMTVYNDWLSISPSLGTGIGPEDYTKVNLSIRTSNTSSAAREAEVTFLSLSSNDAISVKYKISQRGILSVVQSDGAIPASGGSVEATVVSALDWTAEMLTDVGEESIGVQPKNGKAGTSKLYIYASNNDGDTRDFNYLVKAGTAEHYGTVNQAAAGNSSVTVNQLNLIPTLLSFAADGTYSGDVDESGYASVVLGYSANEYTFAAPGIPSWLHLVKGDHKIGVMVDANNTSSKRSYALEISLVADANTKSYLVIEQETAVTESNWQIKFNDNKTVGGTHILICGSSDNYTYMPEVNVLNNGVKISNEPIIVTIPAAAYWLTKYGSSDTSWEVASGNAVWFAVSGSSTSDRSAVVTCQLKNYPECQSELLVVQRGTSSSQSKYFTFSPQSMSVAASDVKCRFSISSNESWSLTLNGDVSFDSTSSIKTMTGTGDANIDVFFSANSSTTNNKTYTISGQSASGLLRSLVITQGKATSKSSVKISSNSETIDSKGGLITVTLTSNVSWNVLNPHGNVKVSPASGNAVENAAINITIPKIANTDNDVTYNIFFRSDDGQASDILTITQTKSDTDTSSIRFISSIINYPYTKDSQTVSIQTSGEYKLVSKPTWVFIMDGSTALNVDGTSTSASLSISVIENKTKKRQGTVVLALVSNPAKTATLTIIQEPSPDSILSIMPTGTTSNSGTIELISDRGWAITDIDPELTITPMNGSGNSTLSFQAEINPYETERVLMATITTLDSAKSSVFKVSQNSGVFRVSHSTLLFSSSDTTREVKIYSSAPWKIISKPNWISVNVMSGGASEEGTAITVTADISQVHELEGNITIQNVVTEAITSIKVMEFTEIDDTYVTLNPSGSVTIDASKELTVNVSVISNRDWTAVYDGGDASSLSGAANVEKKVQLFPALSISATINRSYFTVTAGYVTAELEVIMKKQISDEIIDTPETDKDDSVVRE